MMRSTWLGLSLVAVLLCVSNAVAEHRLASFSVDVTIPLNHRCMGVLPTKSKKVVDPLYAHGFVLLGEGKPIVLCGQPTFKATRAWSSR